MSNDNMRAAVRRLLKRWGAATQMCRRKQEEIAEYNGLIDATYGLHAQKLTGMPAWMRRIKPYGYYGRTCGQAARRISAQDSRHNG